MIDWIYDIETYPNIFTIGFMNPQNHAERHQFEISWRMIQADQLLAFLTELADRGDRMVGYNNQGFDYPVIHHMIETHHQGTNEMTIYAKAMAIINSGWNNRFKNIIWDNEAHIPQVDLFKIHHFDNQNRATKLKMLEFNMRRRNVSDLPYPPCTVLDWHQCDVLMSYMWEDIDATAEFYDRSEHQIRFRDELSVKHNRNFINHNDGKIGKDYIIMKLTDVMPGFDKKRQTVREYVDLADVIFPYVSFEQPGFQRILQWFREQRIHETKGAISDVNCSIDGFQFDFGLGGIHGSIDPQIVTSDDYWIIEDWDVASYYPNLAIKNGLYPEHLGQSFCTIYEEVYEQRKTYAKKTAENAMLKLALNAVFGDSNNQYSCFFDTQYTMAITVNGQLLLCMLAEQLMKLEGLQMIQINTDGMTVKYPRIYQEWVHSVCKWWGQLTKLQLENVEYGRMFVRDVNNYIGEYTDGKVKRKGCYCYESKLDNPFTQDLDWNQNHSSLVVQKAAEAALVRGEDIRTFISNHTDIMDFMLAAKAPGGSRLETVDYHGSITPQQGITRYYIAVMGEDLVKVMPPLKGKFTERRFNINKGWKVSVCNDMDNYVDHDVEFDWYVQEAEKLVKPVRGGA